ncbi:MAG: hypothetical protein KA205_05850 [Acidobacteria bacterium]|nr:hypothetical protein [Acidobacteriota bacterium]
MIPSLRARFNEGFKLSRYTEQLADLETRARCSIEFRISETPCFFQGALMDSLVGAAQSMVGHLLNDAEYRAAADAVVPERFRVANTEAAPTFVQVDFGLVREGNKVEGRLVELQAFPSLYGFQTVLGESYQREYGLGASEGLTPFLDGLDRDGYQSLMRRALVGRHDPANVVLMEIDPAKQKTAPDFNVTEDLWGVRAIDINDVIVDGRRLFYRRNGSLTRIARIYNRVIPDELERKGLSLPFDYRDDIDVEWLGAPDWYFRISKFSIPYLRHPWVPITTFLHNAVEADGRLGAAYTDRERWLLKPLFSFAGGGIMFAPTDEQIAAIPEPERANYILQERVAFTPTIETPGGATQAELRIMLVRDGASYRAVLPLVRMGRGKMMGVDHNKGLDFVGASAAFMTE